MDQVGDGILEILRLHTAEQACHAQCIAYTAAAVIYRRGGRAQTDAVFTVLHGVAVLPHRGKTGHKAPGIGNGVRCKGLHAAFLQQLHHFAVTHAAKQHLAL